MGEKLKVITQVKLKDVALDIELNDGTAKSNKTKYIHLQNDRVRLALSDSEFIQMAIAIRTASNKVRMYKDIKGN